MGTPSLLYKKDKRMVVSLMELTARKFVGNTELLRLIDPNMLKILVHVLLKLPPACAAQLFSALSPGQQKEVLAQTNEEEQLKFLPSPIMLWSCWSYLISHSIGIDYNFVFEYVTKRKDMRLLSWFLRHCGGFTIQEGTVYAFVEHYLGRVSNDYDFISILIKHVGCVYLKTMEYVISNRRLDLVKLMLPYCTAEPEHLLQAAINTEMESLVE